MCVLQDPAVMIQSIDDEKFGTEIICFIERESDSNCMQKVGETMRFSRRKEQETEGKEGLNVMNEEHRKDCCCCCQGYVRMKREE